MSEIDAEKLSAPSKKVDSMILSYKITGLVFLIFVSIPNMGISITISWYEHLFRGVLGPDAPFPNLTLLVFKNKIALPIAALLWPVLGGFAVYWQRKTSHLTFTLLLLVAIVSFQIASTWFALWLPTDGIIFGMSDAAK
jgi:hypothetical protein